MDDVPAGRYDRRSFLGRGLTCGVGLGMGLGLSPLLARALALPRRRDAKAQAVIHVFLQGGLSHLDTFDPKPYAPVEVRGGFGTVRSALGGEPLSDLLRATAKIADRLCLVRSVTHGEAAHERGVHNMLTGYRPSPAITYPSMGSVVAHELGVRQDLPPYVCIPGAGEPFLGTGYLGAAYGPFSVGAEPRSRRFRVRDLKPPKGVGPERRSRRRRLLGLVDRGFGPAHHADAIRALETFYEQAYGLLESQPAREAFNIAAEPQKVRDAYGMTNIGQRLLLARRLAESGVRWTCVVDGGYDNHRDLVRGLKFRVPPLDQGLAALIRDLESRNLLDSTLVVVSSEFGRTPRMNKDSGRDHWPKVFSVALAGGGLVRGCIRGRSDADGSEPEADPTSPADLAATIFHLIGIDPERKLISPGDRPIDIVRNGSILEDLVA